MNAIRLCFSDSLCRSAMALGAVGVLILCIAAAVIAASTWLLFRRQARRRARLWGGAVPQPVAPERANSHRRPLAQPRQPPASQQEVRRAA